jgi:hypothetical protein
VDFVEDLDHELKSSSKFSASDRFFINADLNFAALHWH